MERSNAAGTRDVVWCNSAVGVKRMAKMSTPSGGSCSAMMTT
jgi:hypothetical protein